MEERPETELISIPATPRAVTPEIQTPSGQRSPRLQGKSSTAWTPTSFISPRFLSPIGTPMKRVLINMKGYLEEVGHLTKLNPQDAWLPITESRNGNAHYAAFHNLNAGIGFQALVLPVAFSFLGWSWGILSLTIAYCWQLYTLWILVQLHEAVPGKRYNRYVELAEAAFAVVPQSLADGVYFIPMLDGTNFSDWKDSVQFTLGYMDLDYALRVEQPPAATDTDAQEVIENRQWWERSNRLSLMLIKSRMSKSIRGSIGDCATIKELMQAIEEQFVRSDKALASTLIRQFTTKAFDSSKGMRAYITEMRDIVSQLKGLKIEISEPFLVHFILDSLPSEYGPFKISYNTHKENWSVTDLLTMCVQEEERMKHDRPESANMVVNDKVKTEKGQSGPQKKRKHNVPSKSNGSNGKKVTCFFCKKEGHVKKSCIKYKEWLEKKGFSHQKETNNK